MSNFAITTKLNIYIPMKEEIINKWGEINAILEEAKEKKGDNSTENFTISFLDSILKGVFKTKKFSYLPLIYGVNEDIDEEFKILVCVNFETTYSGLCISNDKLVKMEVDNFYDKVTTLLEKNSCKYQIYDSVLI